MKPEFALSLSFDGIALLVRGAGGWRRVGEIPTDTTDMPTALAALRAKATALPGKPQLHCKLILPDAQIRYLTVTTGELPHDARIAAARKALEGATPYSVPELAFDISPDGAETHVAAVAIETLEEAESFAIEHEFGPVSFVAAPGDHMFLGEPFFGTARAARGVEVEPDGIAVVEIGPLPPRTANRHPHRRRQFRSLTTAQTPPSRRTRKPPMPQTQLHKTTGPPPQPMALRRMRRQTCSKNPHSTPRTSWKTSLPPCQRSHYSACGTALRRSHAEQRRGGHRAGHPQTHIGRGLFD